MAEMSKRYEEGGRELYIGAGGREHVRARQQRIDGDDPVLQMESGEH